MPFRFEQVDNEVIEELKGKRENENTKKSMEHWKNVFVKWANERKQKQNLEEYEIEALDKALLQFYARLRKKMEMTTSRNH